MGLGNVGAVFAFEWRRAMSPGRIAWWLVLAAFPVFLVVMIRVVTQFQLPNGAEAIENARIGWAWALFFLIPMLVTMLGTLLWTAPAVSAELERKSWVYIAIRPEGRTAMLLGKYLAAVTWILPAALVGLLLSVFLCGTTDAARTLLIVFGTTLFACPGLRGRLSADRSALPTTRDGAGGGLFVDLRSRHQLDPSSRQSTHRSMEVAIAALLLGRH